MTLLLLQSVSRREARREGKAHALTIVLTHPAGGGTMLRTFSTIL